MSTTKTKPNTTAKKKKAITRRIRTTSGTDDQKFVFKWNSRTKPRPEWTIRFALRDSLEQQIKNPIVRTLEFDDTDIGRKWKALAPEYLTNK